MKAKNKIIINFLKNLNTFGFIELGNKSVLHLPTGHIIEYLEISFFGELNINEDSKEETIEQSETLILTLNGKAYNINYRKIIDFYIEEYAKRDVLKNGGNFKASFNHMRKHLEYKFAEEGYETEFDDLE